MDDYHTYDNLRIYSLIRGRTLKPEHILCLTCVSALSVSWNSVEKFGNFKDFLQIPSCRLFKRGKKDI